MNLGKSLALGTNNGYGILEEIRAYSIDMGTDAKGMWSCNHRKHFKRNIITVKKDSQEGQFPLRFLYFFMTGSDLGWRYFIE